MKEDESSNRATKQNKEDDNEATEHAARLESSTTASETSEESEEGGDDEADEDEEEVGGVGWVRPVQAGLDVLTNEGVLSIQQNIDRSSKQCTETKEAEKVEDEEEEFDEVHTAPHCDFDSVVSFSSKVEMFLYYLICCIKIWQEIFLL